MTAKSLVQNHGGWWSLLQANGLGSLLVTQAGTTKKQMYADEDYVYLDSLGWYLRVL